MLLRRNMGTDVKTAAGLCQKADHKPVKAWVPKEKKYLNFVCAGSSTEAYEHRGSYKEVSVVKMPDENQVLLKVPRQHNMYTFDMKNVDSSKGYTCLLAKASSNEAKLWHRRVKRVNDIDVQTERAENILVVSLLLEHQLALNTMLTKRKSHLK
ncbi:hypothetical protein Tco_0770751 [Tanacetum coccineum]|uniref:Uncharacterized protein n=1 Tax=Tanacetum coccineum TaxID=301880 RepID=A0ABQ4ZE47_9ASTR